MKPVWIALVCACVFVGGIRAQDEVPAPGKPAPAKPAPGEAEEARRKAAEIDAMIRALQVQHDKLLDKAELAELDDEREEEFKDIQTEVREYLAELRDELKEARAELDEEEGAWREVVLARIKEMRERMVACEEILKLPDATALPEARQLQRAMEIADTKWEMVTEPKIEGAAEREDMIDMVREHGNDADLAALLQQFREMLKADVAASEKQFKLWVARSEAQAKAERLIEAFWQRAEHLEGKDAADERVFEDPPD